MSVPRAKVKSVAGVAEVGRIRVTDQRAPREPASREPAAEGPRVSSRARIASKTLGVPDCPLGCLPAFVRSSPSLSPRQAIPSPFLSRQPLLSFSLRDRTVFPSPPPPSSRTYRACTYRILLHRSRYASITFPLSLSLFPSRCPPAVLRSPRLVLLNTPAAYLPDYLVLGTRYLVLSTRYLVPGIRFDHHGRTHREATPP